MQDSGNLEQYFDDQYPELMGTAHRRPAFAVDAPVLSRHVVIRMAPWLRAATKADSNLSKAARLSVIEFVNSYLVQYSDDKSLFLFADRDTKTPPSAIRVATSESILVRLKQNTKDAFRLRLRIDIYSEYLTMTYLADKIDCENDSKVGAILKRLKDGDTPPLFETGEPSDIAGGSKEANQNTEQLFDFFWDKANGPQALSCFLLPAPEVFDVTGEHFAKAPGGADLFKNIDRAQPIGKLIADFRGMGLCPRDITAIWSSRGRDEMELPPRNISASVREFDDDVYQFIRNRPHFFASVYNFTPEQFESAATQDANVVMCGVSDGAAIYGSGVGRQQERTSDGGRPASLRPQRYFVIYNGFSANQLGRIMRRLHVLGELRVATLLDKDDIRRASARIRALGLKIDEALRSSANGLRAYLSVSDEYNAKFGEIIADGGDGGLVYRVSRSRLYAKTFRERIQDLRLLRIEGWQSYDEFVRRNLFMEFDYINTVGERYSFLERRLERLAAAAQISASAHNIAGMKESGDAMVKFSKTAEQQIELMTEHASDMKLLQKDANTLTHTIAASEEELTELQKIAEAVGAIAFTYYGGTAVADVICALFVGAAEPDAALKAICFGIMLLAYVPMRKYVLSGLFPKKAGLQAAVTKAPHQ